jgi:hypothetical protein
MFFHEEARLIQRRANPRACSDRTVSRSDTRTVPVRALVLTLVLAATAIPVELRTPNTAAWSAKPYPADVVANVLGYVPVGIVFSEFRFIWTGVIATAMALFVEACQFAMMHRTPSPVDLAANLVGALFGWQVSRYSPIAALKLRIARTHALAAIVLGVALIGAAYWTSSPLTSPRGANTTGGLEGHWTMDGSGIVVEDSSGHGHDGRLLRGARLVRGVRGGAASLDGRSGYVDLGLESAFRLKGSTTIAAWVLPSRFPADDAAIVSTHNGLGYQLDTTVDRGPRTIGFKLANACGDLMARYGKTMLRLGEWYYVVGVYDAPRRKIDVYLNGKLDDGPLVGTVTSRQRSSREALVIGRRSDSAGFEFEGLIDDVRLYSRPLKESDIRQIMQGRGPMDMPLAATVKDGGVPVAEEKALPCGIYSDREDARLPVKATVLGALVGIAFLGFRFIPSPVVWLPASYAVGLLLATVSAPELPLFTRMSVSLTSIAGCLAILIPVHFSSGAVRGSGNRSTRDA